MRVVSGVVALVLGLAAIFGAIGLQTIWAPPATLTATTDQTSVDAVPEAPLTVITGGINEVGEDPVDYTLTGEGDYSVMLGQTRDVEAWIGDAAHNTVTGVETEVPGDQDPRVVVEHTEGEATVPDPAGSDLWVDTQEGSGTIDQRWSVPSEGDWALLVAADGTEPAPADVTVTWTNTIGDSPWIVPLAIIGGLLVLLGLALLVWALLVRRRAAQGNTENHHHHNEGGDGPGVASPDARGASTPTAPATPPTGGSGQVSSTQAPSEISPRRQKARARYAGLLAGGLTLAGALGAGPATAQDTQSAPASDASQASDQESSDEGDQYPILTDSQLERILGKIATVTSQADEQQDASALESRVAGQALTSRSANYANVKISDDVQKVRPVASSPILSVVAEADPAFSRTVAVITEGEGDATPQILVLRQESARDQYMLVAATPMTPGAEVPASGLSGDGSETIGFTDKAGLVMSPGNAIAGLARYLTDPEADFADRMVPNAAIDGIHDYQATIEEDAPDAKMTISRRTVPHVTTSLRLPDGSALVVSSLDARMTIAPRTPGDTIVVDELTAARAGEDSTETNAPVDMTYREDVVLRVPAEGATGDEAKVSLVGLSDELQAVSYR
ncbi:hypothetical protein F7P69_00375 [Cellulosimicrobium funkei]|nr:hypothetical protein [Cellulosimicrobium funkei]